MNKTTLSLFLFILTMTSCVSVKKQTESIPNFSFKDELNNEIFEGFYLSDSAKIPKNVYFIK